MSRVRRAPAILLALAASAPAFAQMPATNPEFGELWTRFSDNCLSHFPDDAAVARNADEDGWRTLSGPEATAILQGRPGRAWMLAGRFGVAVLTLEPPPAHSCIVRKNFRSPPKFDDRLAQLIGDWSQDLAPPELASALPPRDSGNETIYAYELRGRDGKAVETVAAIVTHIANSQQVELRLERRRGSDRK